MLRKELVIPPEVAKAFVRDMKLFFKAKTVIDRDEVWKNRLPSGTRLRITDVKELFLQIPSYAGGTKLVR